MPNALRRFRFICSGCGTKNEPACRKCQKPYIFDPVTQPGEPTVRRCIAFPEETWKRLMARAKVTPGVSSPSEYVRLAVYDMLSSLPGRIVQ